MSFKLMKYPGIGLPGLLTGISAHSLNKICLLAKYLTISSIVGYVNKICIVVTVVSSSIVRPANKVTIGVHARTGGISFYRLNAAFLLALLKPPAGLFFISR
jgi:hypothetical protein